MKFSSSLIDMESNIILHVKINNVKGSNGVQNKYKMQWDLQSIPLCVHV